MFDAVGDGNRAPGLDFKALSERMLAYFSGIVGLSFAASAMVQELVFATWGLDFTAIGTPNDVVMGGFRIFTIFIPIFVGLSAFAAASSVFFTTHGQFNNRGWRRTLVYLVCAVIAGGFLALRWARPSGGLSWMFAFGPYRVLVLMGLVAVAILIMMLLRIHAIPRTLLLEHAKENWRFDFSLSAIASIIVMFFALSYTTYLNLSFADGERKLPGICSFGTFTGNGLSYKIRWVGTSSIIVSCGHGMVVILNFGENETLQVSEPRRS